MLKSSQPARYCLPASFTAIDVAMMFLSIFSLCGLMLLTFGHLGDEINRALLFMDTFICCLFLTHWFYGLWCSEDKKQFVKLFWIDFLASIPAVEPLRAARVVQVFRVIRVVRASQLMMRDLFTRRQLTLTTLLVSVVLILCLSTAMILLLESGLEHSNIKTAEQALWWSLVTISTVGYGDYYPVTPLGKLFASMLIICGVSFFGVLSGFVASWLTQKSDLEEPAESVHQETEKKLQTLEAQQVQILNQIKQLKEELQQTELLRTPVNKKEDELL